MNRYIALLRGINVGGKNQISMAELKNGCEALGYLDVRTHLNSGNLLFSTTIDDTHFLSTTLSTMIKKSFDLDIPVFVIEQTAVQDILKNAPDWWGSTDKGVYDNLIFLIPPLTIENFYAAIGPVNEELEQETSYKESIFWSFDRENSRKTKWWSKTASSKIRGQITIRTANTVRKIATM
ncbi:hypothetical protein BAU15_06580 [Enterococcus sp. JM4C]|uniref:DUF1697 domain-containing protein n=1 Tax=Candidatus Enterococcus huntleyi TaxID=1857217 RepID=UPI001379DE06|nr:DUF1697 domain-containing protein [Enterococcus sp. JM4C]KAF1297209.1 hypothetical protein BAU15_06580 [Enterococcus sp. JM4C]